MFSSYVVLSEAQDLYATPSGKIHYGGMAILRSPPTPRDLFSIEVLDEKVNLNLKSESFESFSLKWQIQTQH